MKNTFGESVCVTLFGESHGNAIGAILDGMAPGIRVDSDFIAKQMCLRRSVSSLSTARKEADAVEILSGVKDGFTTGTPIAFMIRNGDTKSKDYESLKTIARPGHADYSAYCKYHGFSDTRGGGHFSGRITAGLVAAGAVAITALSEIGIHIGTHIAKCAGICDRNFENYEEDIEALSQMPFAVLDEQSAESMRTEIEAALVAAGAFVFRHHVVLRKREDFGGILAAVGAIDAHRVEIVPLFLRGILGAVAIQHI
ncbi:MAG: chorismate synthase, partial [Clostridia bacterium]|nr:chorismate synthase [Clostridia bacterium]